MSSILQLAGQGNQLIALFLQLQLLSGQFRIKPVLGPKGTNDKEK